MKHIFFAISLLFCFGIDSMAQIDYNFLAIRGVPQNMYSNPAQMPRFKYHIGLPAISSFHLSAYSSSLSWGEIVTIREDGSTLIDLEGSLDKLNDKNYISIQSNIDLLSFSFRQKSNYFSFAVRERIEMRFSYPKSLIDLMWNGNGGELLGEKVYLDGLGLDFIHFREYGFGFSHDFNGKLILGGRFKYLKGISSFTTDKSELFFITDPESYRIYVAGRFSSNSAGLTDENGDRINYPIVGSKNNGFGIDLGMRYKINDKWEVAAALNDYGYIKWSANAYKRYDDSVLFVYNGVRVNNAFNASAESDSISTNLAQSIDTALTLKSKANSYITEIPSSLSIGGHFHLNKLIGLSAYYNHFSYRGEYIPGLILNSRFTLKNWIELTANYSIHGNSFFNIGGGVVLNLGVLQIYGVTNNILAHVKPTEVRNANFRLGLNLIFGRKMYKR